VPIDERAEIRPFDVLEDEERPLAGVLPDAEQGDHIAVANAAEDARFFAKVARAFRVVPHGEAFDDHSAREVAVDRPRDVHAAERAAADSPEDLEPDLAEGEDRT
jgi:hypothetical protein